jgi:hypothetical protein
MNKKIFDLTKIDKEVKAQLRLGKDTRTKTHLYKMILSLFEIKKTLTIDEIIIGLFRKYKYVSTRYKIKCYISSYKKFCDLKYIDHDTFKLEVCKKGIVK